MYIKLIDLNELTYFREDFFFLKELTKNVTFQPLSKTETQKFNTLRYIIGNSKNKSLKSLKIHFDFKNSTITIDDIKVFEVKADANYTIKKSGGNLILANNGIDGVYNFIFESMNINKSAFYSWSFYCLANLINKY